MNQAIPYEVLEELASVVTTGQIVYNGLTMALSIAAYVLRSIGLYAIAKRRGIANPWLAWIPVAWVWVLGSISDQFRYVTKAQVKSRRKVLLVLSIVYSVICAVIFALCLVNILDVIELAMNGTEEQMFTWMLTFVFQMMGLGLLAFVMFIVYAVFFYIALYDLYNSVNPPCNVLFLVLSILFSITAPFFIFFNRKKDDGMPPRCDVIQEPVSYISSTQEPWEKPSEE